jgi:hypothetical protein
VAGEGATKEFIHGFYRGENFNEGVGGFYEVGGEGRGIRFVEELCTPGGSLKLPILQKRFGRNTIKNSSQYTYTVSECF